jgi:protein-tyrosine phosphatase
MNDGGADRRSTAFNMDGGIHHVPIPGSSGRLWLCGKHHIGPDPEGALTRVGASHVVCLVHEHEIADRYPDYRQWLTSSGRSTWFPIHDLTSPPLPDVLPLYRDVHARLSAGETLIAHCAAGIGRAGTLAVAVCMLSGMTVEDAMAHVRRHRPGAGPEVGSQREMLDQLAIELET